MEFQEFEERIRKMVSRLKGKVGLIIKTDKETLSINGEETFSSASLIKIPIILAAYRSAEKNMLNLEETVKVNDEDKADGSGVLYQLSNINLTIKDLLTLMISVSDNTATNIIIKKLGIESIKKVCVEIGCQHTLLARKMMDWEAIEKGIDNITSPSDMILFLIEITKGTYLSLKSKNEIFRILSLQQLNDKLTFSLFNQKMVIAHKTGELPGIEHDVGVFEHKGKQVLIAMLYDGGSNAAREKMIFPYIGILLQEYLIST